MLQPPEAEDFVVSTGPTYSLKEFVEFAFSFVGLDFDYKNHVARGSAFCRPSEVDILIDNALQSKRKAWRQHTTKFPELIYDMSLNQTAEARVGNIVER
jgi:GDPmannose 4,6-dehydratase